MDDERIVALYFARDEKAIVETDKKYGKYCHYIAMNVLSSNEDAEECVNDTYLATWENIPPTKPQVLRAFLGKLTRNLAIDRYREEHAEKRKAPTTLVLDEVAECIPDPASEADVLDEIALADALNAFLETLSDTARIAFVKRYFYCASVRDVARDLDVTETHVKVLLHRTRKKCKAFLLEKGVTP